MKEAVFILLGRVSPTVTEPNPRWVPTGNAFCISERLVIAARHCLRIDSNDDYGELCVARAAHRAIGSLYGYVPLKRTGYRDDKADLIILERDSDGVFPYSLELCNFSALPRVDDQLRACYAPCDLIFHGENTVLEVTLGPLEQIHHYSPETEDPKKLLNNFMPVLGSIESPRSDPNAVLISLGTGLHGGCCGAPYIDQQNRVVAIHLYSGNDAPVIETVVRGLIKEHAEKVRQKEEQQKWNKKRRRADADAADADAADADAADEGLTSNSGYASIKQGIVLAKVETLVLAIRELLNVDLNVFVHG